MTKKRCKTMEELNDNRSSISRDKMDSMIDEYAKKMKSRTKLVNEFINLNKDENDGPQSWSHALINNVISISKCTFKDAPELYDFSLDFCCKLLQDAKNPENLHEIR